VVSGGCWSSGVLNVIEVSPTISWNQKRIENYHDFPSSFLILVYVFHTKNQLIIPTIEINFVAIAIAVVANFLLGFLWYIPLTNSNDAYQYWR